MTKPLLVRWLYTVGLVIANLSCDESLPPYKDPSDVMEAENDALYVISNTDNSLKVFVTLRNTYDDTFQGTAFFDGTVTISLAGDSTFQKTFFVSPSNILSGKYDASSQQLTIDSGGMLKLIFSWNFIDDTGRNIRGLISYDQDPTCQQRYISDQLTFTIRSEVKVFEKIGFASSPPFSYPTIHQREYFPPSQCTPGP